MKKASVIILVFILALSLFSCASLGGTSSSTDTSAQAASSAGASSQNGGDESRADSDRPAGADSGIPAEVFTKRTDKPIEDVVGKLETGSRIVRRLSDSFLQTLTGGWDNKPIAEYEVVTFGDDGFVSDFCLYYVFADETTFWNSFNKSSCAFIEMWCREWSDSKYYYGFYSIPAILDGNSDGKISWDEAWKDMGEPDDNYIIIQ